VNHQHSVIHPANSHLRAISARNGAGADRLARAASRRRTVRGFAEAATMTEGQLDRMVASSVAAVNDADWPAA
jgi:hypothetical protein